MFSWSKHVLGNLYMNKFKKQPREYNPTEDLLDEQLIANAILECLNENDLDGVIDILEAHLSAILRNYD